MNDKDHVWQIYLAARRRNPQEAVNVTVSLAHLRSILTTADIVNHIDWLTLSNNRRLKMLDRPFPSAPLHPGKYELKIKRDDGAFNIHVYSAIYPAKKFLDIIIGDRRTFWIDRKTLRCHDLTISSKFMERMFTHVYTPEEEEWLLPMPYAYYARKIAFNEDHTAAPTGPGEVNRGHPMSKRAKRAQARAERSEPAEKGALLRSPRDPHRKTPVDTTKGRIGVKPRQPKEAFGPAEIADTTGKEPSKVRAWLRSNRTKPAGGWAFTQEEFEAICTALKK